MRMITTLLVALAVMATGATVSHAQGLVPSGSSVDDGQTSAREWWMPSPNDISDHTALPSGSPLLRARTDGRVDKDEPTPGHAWLKRASRPLSWTWRGVSLAAGTRIPLHEYRDPGRRGLLAGRLGPPRWPSPGLAHQSLFVGTR